MCFYHEQLSGITTIILLTKLNRTQHQVLIACINIQCGCQLFLCTTSFQEAESVIILVCFPTCFVKYAEVLTLKEMHNNFHRLTERLF